MLAALYGPLPHVFTSDPRVIDRLHAIWPLFAAMQPAAAAVFALDGVLIGAGDTRYLAFAMVLAALAFYVPIALLALHLHWGIVGVWSGLLAPDRRAPRDQRRPLPATTLDRARRRLSGAQKRSQYGQPPWPSSTARFTWARCSTAKR